MPVYLKINEVMKERGMSSKELAQIIDTTEVTISRIKNNQVKGMRFSTLYAICRALECDPGDIMYIVIDDEDE